MGCIPTPIPSPGDCWSTSNVWQKNTHQGQFACTDCEGSFSRRKLKDPQPPLCPPKAWAWPWRERFSVWDESARKFPSFWTPLFLSPPPWGLFRDASTGPPPSTALYGTLPPSGRGRDIENDWFFKEMCGNRVKGVESFQNKTELSFSEVYTRRNRTETHYAEVEIRLWRD